MKHTLFALLILAAVDDLPAAQRTFVSATNGVDTNSCTPALPCRNFAAAILLADPNGEVVVLNSGGYGPVQITKSVSLIAPRGVYAGITAFSGDAVYVSALDTDHVALTNLTLNGQGADNGIDISGIASVDVDGCVISGFATYGIWFTSPTDGAQLYVIDTVVRRTDAIAVVVAPRAAVNRAMIDSVSLDQNGSGFFVESGEATIRQSKVSGYSGTGFFASTSSKVLVEDSVSTGMIAGFAAYGGGVMTLSRCAVTSNTKGLQAYGTGSIIYVSDSTITANDTSVTLVNNGAVFSRGNNMLQGNTTNSLFTGFYPSN
jgi:parallel beta helix pectate lyase-like protein